MTSRMLSIVFPLLLAFTAVSAQICRIDLGIILDDSGSIKNWGFEQEKNFVRSVTRQLHVSGSNTRVAVMTFSSRPRMRVHFRDRAGQNWNSLNWALNGIRHWGGWTYTDKALEMARTRMFHEHYGSRKGAPKMLLLLTDGKSQSGSHRLSRAATLLKNNFVNIISIGVGYQIRRSELELIASRPISQHVFQVKDVWALNRIVNTVKTEACKPITCWYIHCVYNEWSSWSGTCYRVRRTRTVRQEIRKSKMVVGGCAGLNVLNCKPRVEEKNLGVCLRTCNYVECKYGQWSQWSTTCGRGERRRNMQAIRKTTQRVNCNGLPRTCSKAPDIQTRSQKCTCNYVECKYGQWSQWSTTCGRGERRRNMQAIRKTTQRVNCNGLPQTCSKAPDIQTRSQKCTCNYVECKYGQWSQWSTTCGRGERRRNMQAIRKTTQRVNCNGLPQTCSKAPDIQTRSQKCTCNYVECKYGQWSQWSTTCGRGERRRNMQAIRKTTQRVNCNGLPQTCSKAPDIQTRSQKCSCNYVECKYGAWSVWSTSCGKGKRSRQMQAVKKTVQRENCNGLPTSCPTNPDIETRTKMCRCNYVECKYGEWSAWTSTCGKGERGRKLKPIPKSKEAESCDNLPKTCSVTPDVESRTTMCTCNYVDCQYGPWSEWTTTCGQGARSRKMQAIRKTKQAEKCDGLTQSCPTTPDIENRNKLCKCDYVECKYTEWTSWNPTCGKNIERKRNLQTIKKTVEKASCDGLTTKCTGDAEQTEKKNELCECDAVKCEMQWSAWSASCGLVKRTLRFVKVPIKVKQESCDGLTTTCPDTVETQVDDLPCPKTAPPIPTTGPSAADAACSTGIKAIGCLKDSKEVRQEFSKALFVDLYKKSNTFTYSDYIDDIVCRCAKMATAEKLHYFAISSTGQCLAGKDGEDNWLKHSAAKGNFCLSSRLDNCLDDDTHCIGKEGAVFGYKIAL